MLSAQGPRLRAERGRVWRPRQQAGAAAVAGARGRKEALVRALVERPVRARQAHLPAVVHQRRVCAARTNHVFTRLYGRPVAGRTFLTRAHEQS